MENQNQEEQQAEVMEPMPKPMVVQQPIIPDQVSVVEVPMPQQTVVVAHMATKVVPEVLVS